MADAGLTVYGDSGIFQIDNTYRNLVLREKGTLVTDSTLYNGGTGNVVTYKSIGLRNGFTSPVICVGGNVLAQPEQQWSGSQVGFVVSASGPIGTSVPYWIFDVATPPPSSGSGLCVWDSAGNLIFNTDSPPMRVVNFAANNDNPNWTGTAGRSYAVAHVVRGYRQVSVEGQFIRGTFTQVNGANVTGSFVQVAATSGTPTTMIKQLTSIILDVTNY